MKTSQQIRDAFREYFRRQGHEVVPSASLLPQNDPTLIFVNAGMVPFKDVFTGKDSRPYRRATSSQKCIRISGKHNDLENVGVTARHHTFFEMLGNFSFGDYFKEAAIAYAWELLTKDFGLAKERLVVTVFEGEQSLPADEEAAALWKKLGVPADRILRCGAADNFWSMGDTGPCGPCSELHYFFGEGAPEVSLFGQEPGADGRGWVELWNLVFMQFDRQKDGTLHTLPAPSIDTGAGLERLCCALQGVLSNYDTDLLRPIVERTAEIAGKRYGGGLAPDDVSMRVIADHARTTAFLIAEGVTPDRAEREYVLRRVMRRAIRHAQRLGIVRPFLHECALLVADRMSDEYPELRERRALIESVTQQEEARFRQTITRGLARLHGWQWPKDGKPRVLPGAVAFELYDTHGFPYDLQEVIGREEGFSIDKQGFERELEAARKRSEGSKVGDEAVETVYRDLAQTVRVTFKGYELERCPSTLAAIVKGPGVFQRLEAGERAGLVTRETPFYAESGGQVGDRGLITCGDARFIVEDTIRPTGSLVVHVGVLERGTLEISRPLGTQVELEIDHARRAATRRNHSATHLLHLSLREVVGEHAMQKGSLVGPERLRFDYACSTPPTREQLAEIERMVTDRVLKNVEVTTGELSMAEAKGKGAIGIFEEKYGEVVRMLKIDDSLELCGGTHVARTGDIGGFKIVADTGIAAGVRRIEAVTGHGALAYARELERELFATAELLRGSPLSTRDKVEKLLEQRKAAERELEQLKKKLVAGGSRDLAEGARKLGGVTVLGTLVDVADPAALRELADSLRDRLAPAVVVLGAQAAADKAVLVCTVSKELTSRFKAGSIVNELAAIVGGRGGGRPDFAQAGGSDPGKLATAMARVYAIVEAG